MSRISKERGTYPEGIPLWKTLGWRITCLSLLLDELRAQLRDLAEVGTVGLRWQQGYLFARFQAGCIFFLGLASRAGHLPASAARVRPALPTHPSAVYAGLPPGAFRLSPAAASLPPLSNPNLLVVLPVPL